MARALVQFAPTNWKRLLATITGSVDQELILCNGYLGTENRILRNLIQGRLQLTDLERISLATTGKRLGRQALEEVAQIIRPETRLSNSTSISHGGCAERGVGYQTGTSQDNPPRL